MATFGNTTPGGNSTSDSGGTTRGSKFVLTESAVIQSISLYCKVTNPGTVKIKMGIYSDNSGSPDAKKVESQETSFTNTDLDWVTCNVTPNVNLTAGTYWLVWMNDGGTGTGGLQYGENVVAGAEKYNVITYPTFVDPFNVSGTQNLDDSIYATYTLPTTGFFAVL